MSNTDDTVTPPPTLADAFDELAVAYAIPVTPDNAPAIVTRAALAQAIATAELARATQLAALAAFLAAPVFVATTAERDDLTRTARVLAGLPADFPMLEGF